ncbi:MAG: substrate-binding domain-containing protein [Tyzzerella sp.]|nr:substrate-binding domain-containing protein [Tyzzerella sp.]
MKLKKFLALSAAVVMTMSVAVGCGNTDSEGEKTEFDSSYEITVISREDGSGTRSAFVELVGVEQKDESGEKVDYTTEEAIITSSTSVMLSTVADDEYAIGYVSLGSLNDTVKALKVDGAEATEENIKSGAYKVARPFNIATKDEVSEVTQDFINYILSEEGQAIVSENGYISLDEAEPFAGTNPEGKIVIAGSTSVTPVMEKIKEAYLAINKNAEIEIQTNDSSTGMNWAIEGTCDIGMASRELKEAELNAGLTATVIATDGIAVIVNHANTLDDITTEQIKNIYVGDAYTWDEVTD